MQAESEAAVASEVPPRAAPPRRGRRPAAHRAVRAPRGIEAAIEAAIEAVIEAAIEAAIVDDDADPISARRSIRSRFTT